jgi:serine protease Do
LNILGELIGVNTAIRGDAQNVGFAIPVDRVRFLLPDLLGVATKGRVKLGIVWGAEVDAAGRRGVAIAKVEPDSPAKNAKLAPGEVVSQVAGTPTPSLIDALVAMLDQPVGKPFPITIAANGAQREVKLTIEELPKPDGAKLALQKFGFTVSELDSTKASHLGLRAGAGLIVTDVQRGSPAAEVGIESGDIVAQLGEYGVRDLGSLGLLLEQVKRGDEVPVTIVRIRGRSMFRSAVILPSR